MESPQQHLHVSRVQAHLSHFSGGTELDANLATASHEVEFHCKEWVTFNNVSDVTPESVNHGLFFVCLNT